MARCVQCLSICSGLVCSVECANERMAIMLEGVELLDELLAMVDAAAEGRAGRAAAAAAAAAQPAASAKRPRPVQTAAPAADGTMPLLLAVPAAMTPEALDPP